jgi:hypothetical protein
MTEKLKSKDIEPFFLKLWVVIPKGLQVIRNYLKYSCIHAQNCQVSRSVTLKTAIFESVAAAGETF